MSSSTPPGTDVYLADVRARLEHIERMKRKCLKLMAAGAVTGERQFDPDRPWEWSLAEVISDNQYWKREL